MKIISPYNPRRIKFNLAPTTSQPPRSSSWTRTSSKKRTSQRPPTCACSRNNTKKGGDKRLSPIWTSWLQRTPMSYQGSRKNTISSIKVSRWCEICRWKLHKNKCFQRRVRFNSWLRSTGKFPRPACSSPKTSQHPPWCTLATQSYPSPLPHRVTPGRNHLLHLTPCPSNTTSNESQIHNLPDIKGHHTWWSLTKGNRSRKASTVRRKRHRYTCQSCMGTPCLTKVFKSQRSCWTLTR